MECIVCGERRSIPACAGEPRCQLPRTRPVRVYPRVCGGTQPRPTCGTTWSGLSPRVRGNLCPQCLQPGHRRSIPACAGEPPPYPLPSATCAVYPRVCGGTVPEHLTGENSNGLSPRVRGNRTGGQRRGLRPRSIPACAGEPGYQPAPAPAHRVYPRVCGGTTGRVIPRPFIRGLSPRVRGNLPGLCAERQTQRSIPACAGEPSTPTPVRLWGMVYPRVCGGTSRRGRPAQLGIGLSPRVRGNRQQQVHRVFGPGSIPACAGEPDAAADEWPQR